MFKEKILKVLTATACIATLVMPHISTALAVTLTNDSSTVGRVDTINLLAIKQHEGGNAYRAKQSGNNSSTEIYKIIVEEEDGKYDYSNEFYCIDVNNTFPQGVKKEYERVIDDFFAENPSKNFPENEGNNTYLHLTDEQYNSLSWFLKNMYLRKQMNEEQREEELTLLLENACQDILNGGYSDIESVEDLIDLINEDDIEIMQQWAIWYFTNYGEKTIQGIDIVQQNQSGNVMLPMLEVAGLTLDNYDTMNPTKKDILNHLYQYFIKTAEMNQTVAPVTAHPAIVETRPSSSIDGSNYKIGPFKVSAGTNVLANSYSIKLMSGNNEITNYTLKDENGNTISEKIESVVNQNYYIYVPVTGTDGKDIKLKLNYYDTKASVWKKVSDTNDLEYDETHQPVILLTRELEEDSISLKTNADLALRKYIVAVNGKEVSNNRKPNITITDGKIEYKHRKDAVEVKPGDMVTYEITVYNEGNVNATATEIVDYLPDNLEFVEGNTINDQYGWKVNGNVVTTTRTKSLAPFANDTIDIDTVQIVCKVKNTATSGEILTNIAEIKADNIEDIDSEPNSFETVINSINKPDYKGNDKNPADLSNSDYFYEGRQDDDDFEKVKVAGRPFDLSLQKFITKVNGQTLSESREPKVNTNPLKNGLTNAEYEQVKTPVVVKPGDIVTYTIRVYNEGETNGYAESVADYLPDGLGYLVNYKANIDNYWAIPENLANTPVKLTESQLKNLKIEDFTGETNLNDITVIKGPIKLTSTALSSSKSNTLINAFDGSDKLDYKDIEITCIVLEDSNLKNIAEVTKDLDENKNEVEDRDSIPDTVNPDNYPGNDENQDDHDYEILTMKKFDLSLQKFITGLNDKKITDRVPVVSYNDGKISYAHPETPLEVNNGDNITYTIRVYNEGEVDGYAAEIGDDIPNGLIFDPQNQINQKYGWKMIDSNGNETTDVNKAVEIRTDYLSKEKAEARQESALLTAFDSEKGNLFYLDVEAVFKVNATSSDSTITNTAEITKDTDEDGNEIEDIDSIPDNKKEGEDDIDQEKIHVGYFDLALQKDLTKAIVTEGNATNEIIANEGELLKVEINRKKLNSTIVKFVYNITITNEGTIPGYATQIRDYIPEGLQFVEADNQNWKEDSAGTIVTDALAKTLLQPGEKASVEVTLRWINGENNLGTKINVAEISEDYNDANDVDDIDSTPDNKVEGEDDIDDAPVILTISTGRAPMYIILTTTVLTIIGTGIVAIKKYVL